MSEKGLAGWYDLYVSKGYHVIPVYKNRLPGIKWKELQTRPPTEEEIKQFKEDRKQGWPNLGFVTGKTCGVTVIDCDSAAAVAEVEARLPVGFHVPIVHSPKGRHYHFKYCNVLNTTTHKGKSKSIDIRSDGGFAVLPPSTKESGGYYRWDETHNIGTTTLKPIPEKLIYLLALSQGAGRTRPKGSVKLEEGVRDDTIFLTACSMRDRGVVREETLKACLGIAAACTPPFSKEETLKKVDSAYSYVKRGEERVEEESDESMSVWLDDVEEEEMEWLWENYIPSCAITLISGDPDAGKSWWVLDLCSRLSRGTEWADGTPVGRARNSLYMTYEDSPSKLIKKRARMLNYVGAAGDGGKIAVRNRNCKAYTDLSSPGGRQRLRNEIIRLGDMGIVAIDPILDFTKKMNPNAVEEVRELLTPLVEMAEELNFALILITHLNKDQNKGMMYRSSGSVGGWKGKSRAAFTVVRDPTDPEKRRRIVFAGKNNYAWPEPEHMDFVIIEKGLIVHTTDADPDEVMNPKRGRPVKEAIEASEFIANMFEDRQQIPAAEVSETCKSHGITANAVRDVRVRMKYKSQYDREIKTNVWIRPEK